MMSIKKIIRRTPVLGRIFLMATRLVTALGYFVTPVKELARWLIRSKETTNFTYDLDELNKKYLAAFVAGITKSDYRQIMEYLSEIETDLCLKEHIRVLTLASPQCHLADSTARFGRRIGWYAFVRATKPAIILETGVDKGLGACVLTAALMRNSAEGHPGYYYGTDVNLNAGYLLQGEYAKFGCVLYGDSIESLAGLDKTIDLFINDSDHSLDYEAKEYETIADKMSDEGIILSDNAHACGALLDFANRTGRQFSYFQEKPRAHWYPGAGIGAAFRGS